MDIYDIEVEYQEGNGPVRITCSMLPRWEGGNSVTMQLDLADPELNLRAIALFERASEIARNTIRSSTE